MNLANYSFLLFLFLLFPFLSPAQETTEYQWINPVTDDRIQFYGQGWNHEVLASPFDRLPAKAENTVRGAVWGLSRNATGIYLSFTTDAPEITVRYQTNPRYEMPHMPATGVSGLDLYVRTPTDNALIWCRGRYSFRDTITYTFPSLNTRNPVPGHTYEYNLYLPLYNAVKWMEIGIPANHTLSAAQPDSQKPILVYGTSIAQGGCASRPAMGWTSIVQRSLDRPVINLAFSGNGRLETEVIALINEIDAEMYILDCLPNLTIAETYPDDELRKRIRESVLTLRNSHPNAPILLTEHAGYSDDQVTASRYDAVERVNRIQKEMWKTLKNEGVTRLYYLSKDDIDMCMDCTVDGTHQTDLGMQYYGDAYTKKIREIFNQ